MDWQERLLDIDEGDYELSENEAEFVSTMVDRYTRYGDRTYISEKQIEFINSIWDRHCSKDTTTKMRGLPKLKTWDDIKDK